MAGALVLARPDAHSLFAGAEPETTPPVDAAQSDQDLTTTLTDQAELSLTVYNSDIALVRDVRNLQLSRGIGNLRFMDIAATVNPATVHFRSLTEPAQVSVLEQNYEYDLLDPDKLLRKYVGREVTLMRNRQEGGTTRQEEVKALLLSYNTSPVWKIGNEIVTGLGADHIRFPELPDSLYSRPTLIWTVQNDGAAKHRVEASYLARSLAWNADYVLTVGARRQGRGSQRLGHADQQQRHRVQEREAAAGRRRSESRAPAVEQDDGSRRARADGRGRGIADGAGIVLRLSPLHDGPEDVDQQRADQAGQPARRHRRAGDQALRRRGTELLLPQPDAPGLADQGLGAGVLPVQERREGGLGMPMPAGVLRVYQQDSKGGMQFVGEDRIMHTPKDETLNVKIGNAFDVICERNQTDFTKIATNVYEFEYEITLRNHKATAINVEVNEPVGGTWRMITLVAPVDEDVGVGGAVQGAGRADGTAVLKYRVRVTY